MEFKNIQLTEHFTLYEMCKSPTAEQNGIDNVPCCEQIVNMYRLAKELETIRKYFNGPLRVHSGFRCLELNKAVGGAEHSDHLSGSAVDITSDDNEKLWRIIVNLAHNRDKIRGNEVPLIHMRQIIDEKNLKWIHLSVNNKKNSYKNNEILHL